MAGRYKHTEDVLDRLEQYVDDLEVFERNEDEESIHRFIIENSLDGWLENQFGDTECKNLKTRKLGDDEDAVGVVSWLGIAGFLLQLDRF
ncbi:MAG: hypothetical protein QF475_02030 [Candidatus Undinarchaeales archaeon]|jgi:hypothetical protein|nr:hypothetical protein [Candidatus Undinarchaeales archaeon]